MQVSQDTVVSFHYLIKDSSGNELENASTGEPMLYLHGASNILPGLEAGLEGKSAGETVEIVLAPEDGYGNHDPELQQRIPTKHLDIKKNAKLKPGDIVAIKTKEGLRQVRVLKAGKFQVTVDANHPFAGMELHFTVTLKEVREATADELAHGHAHGPGGHHH